MRKSWLVFWPSSGAVLWALEVVVFPDGKDVEREYLSNPDAVAFLDKESTGRGRVKSSG